MTMPIAVYDLIGEAFSRANLEPFKGKNPDDVAFIESEADDDVNWQALAEKAGEAVDFEAWASHSRERDALAD
jgi:hypothetical protein